MRDCPSEEENGRNENDYYRGRFTHRPRQLSRYPFSRKTCLCLSHASRFRFLLAWTCDFSVSAWNGRCATYDYNIATSAFFGIITWSLVSRLMLNGHLALNVFHFNPSQNHIQQDQALQLEEVPGVQARLSSPSQAQEAS